MAEIIYIVDPKTSPKRVTLKRINDSDKNTHTRFPKFGKTLLLTEDLKSGKYNISSNVLKPKVISPLNLSNNYRGEVTITKYTPSSIYKLGHTRTIVELSTDRAFNNIIRRVDTDEDIETLELLPLTSKTKNYIRVRHESGLHISEWSDTVEVEVAQLEYVAKPYIIAPVSNATKQLVRHLFIKTSAFVLIGALDASHEYTEYQISKDEYFNNVIATDIVRGLKTDIVVSNITLEYETQYYIRVRYKATKYQVSDWSDTIQITTQNTKLDLGIDGLHDRLGGTDLDGAYYGLVPNGLLLARNYRGQYKENLTYYNNQTVEYNNIMYTANKTNKNITPDDLDSWRVDNEDGLPTYRWLLDNIGIGYGLTDNNVDNNSTEGSVSGTIVNENESWLKTAYMERLIYISKKPILENISWNDLSKKYLCNGYNRTIKIGTRLYYVRLISEEEVNNILIPLTDGTIYNLDPNDLGLNTPCWVDSNDSGTTRKVMSGSSTVNIDASSRTNSFRVVLELVYREEEPYKRIPDSLPKAQAENFQYDSNTDTGYFGLVSAPDIIYGNDLAAVVNLSDGTLQNNDTYWLKFYWHGMLIYTPMKPIRYGILKDDLLSLNIVHGTPLSSKPTKAVNISGNILHVGLLTGSTKAPSENITTSGDPQSTDNFTINVRKEIGKGSMWNELIYRVHGTFVDDDVNNQGTLNYIELHGGIQIGDNWDILSSDDLGIAQGNGSNTICQEVNSSNPLESISRGYYFLPGVVRQNFNQRLPIFGWRPILISKIERES